MARTDSVFFICPGRARHFGIGSAHLDVNAAVKVSIECRGAWKEDVGVSLSFLNNVKEFK